MKQKTVRLIVDLPKRLSVTKKKLGELNMKLWPSMPRPHQTVVLTVHVDRAVRDAISNIADELGWSRDQLVGLYLERAVFETEVVPDGSEV